MSNCYDLILGWQDYQSVGERKIYLRQAIAEQTNNFIRAATFKPAGFDRTTSHLFLVAPEEQIKKLINLQLNVIDKIKKLPDNLVFHSDKWYFLQNYLRQQSREFKIHLQPEEDQIPVLLHGLIELIMADKFLQQNIAGFKALVKIPDYYIKENRATIVIYLCYHEKRHQARYACQQVLSKLKTGLIEYEQYAENRLPVYNFPVTPLISFIQLGTDTKMYLLDILGQRRFDKLFPFEFYQALLMDENPQFYVPEYPLGKLDPPQIPSYRVPKINEFRLIASKVVGMIEYMPQDAYCCPVCKNLHKFNCTSDFWNFDCESCDKDNAPCQTVKTQQGEIQVFTCPKCKSHYRIFRDDQERHSIKIIS